MKSKYHNELKIISYIMSTERYKLVFFLSMIVTLYGGFVLGASSTDNFIDSILVPFQFPIFNDLLFAILFLNNLNTCSIFKQDFSFYIIRLESKRKYIRTLLRLSSLMFLIQFTISLLFILMCLFVTTFQNIQIQPYQTYEISNLVFCVFYLLRYLLFGLLTVMISTLIYLNSNQKVTLIVNGVFLILMYYFGNVSFQDGFCVLIWSYYTNTIYSSFSLECASSLFMTILLESMMGLLYYISNKNNKVEIL